MDESCDDGGDNERAEAVSALLRTGKTGRAPTDPVHLPTLPYTSNHHASPFKRRSDRTPRTTTRRLWPSETPLLLPSTLHSLGHTWDAQTEESHTQIILIHLPELRITASSTALLTDRAGSRLLRLASVRTEPKADMLAAQSKNTGTYLPTSCHLRGDRLLPGPPFS